MKIAGIITTMVTIATGLWWYYSQPAGMERILTLRIDHGNYLLSALVLLVTLAETCLWNIVTIYLHSRRLKKSTASALDLEHQVIIRNSPSSLGTLWQAFKIYRAWVKIIPREQGLCAKTLWLAIPAMLVWGAFAAASILVSLVATTKPYNATVGRVLAQDCGFWTYNTTSTDISTRVHGLQGQNTKVSGLTLEARLHSRQFPANTSSSPTARNIFVQPTLPYRNNSSAPCPIQPANRCWLGPNGAYSVTSDPIDSHSMLGVNSKPTDRITLQMTKTCSPVHAADLTTENSTFVKINLGQSVGYSYAEGPDETYAYNKATPQTGVNYLLVPFYAKAHDEPELATWTPIPDFNRTDADVTALFLSGNNVRYLQKVFDPWFLANGTWYGQFNDLNFTVPNFLLNLMVCADSYILCNPNNSTCTARGGVAAMGHEALTYNTPWFNAAQLATAARLLFALERSTMFYTVESLGAGALWASDRLQFGVSPGLPETQWHDEVLGWFATSLAKIQAFMIDYADTASANLGPYGIVKSPRQLTDDTDTEISIALEAQCTNQLVQTTGEVQNFSFLGIIVIVCMSVLLVIVSMTLEWCLDNVGPRRRRKGVGWAARRADNNLHLFYRSVVDPPGHDTQWSLGAWDVPIYHGLSKFERPDGSEELGGYTASEMIPAPGYDEYQVGATSLEMTSITGHEHRSHAGTTETHYFNENGQESSNAGTTAMASATENEHGVYAASETVPLTGNEQKSQGTSINMSRTDAVRRT